MQRKKNRKQKNRNSTFIAIALFAVGIISLAVATKLTLKPTQQGQQLGARTYLARDGGDSESSGSGSSGNDSSNEGSGSSSSGSSTSGSSSSGSGSDSSTSEASTGSSSGSSSSSEKTTSNTNQITPTTRTTKITPTQESTIETEVETDLEPPELKMEDNIELEKTINEVDSAIGSTDRKITIETKDGSRVLKKENAQGKEIDLSTNEIEDVDNTLREMEISISHIAGEELLFTKGTVGAVSTEPISVNIGTRQVEVKTENGNKNISITPDVVVNKLKALSLIDKVISTRNDLGANTIVNLETNDGKLVYKVDGTKRKRILGTIPVDIKRTITISAETGEVLQEKSTQQFIETISF